MGAQTSRTESHNAVLVVIRPSSPTAPVNLRFSLVIFKSVQVRWIRLTECYSQAVDVRIGFPYPELHARR
jgi:hypothetical protein